MLCSTYSAIDSTDVYQKENPVIGTIDRTLEWAKYKSLGQFYSEIHKYQIKTLKEQLQADFEKQRLLSPNLNTSSLGLNLLK